MSRACEDRKSCVSTHILRSLLLFGREFSHNGLDKKSRNTTALTPDLPAVPAFRDSQLIRNPHSKAAAAFKINRTIHHVLHTMALRTTIPIKTIRLHANQRIERVPIKRPHTNRYSSFTSNPTLPASIFSLLILLHQTSANPPNTAPATSPPHSTSPSNPHPTPTSSLPKNSRIDLALRSRRRMRRSCFTAVVA